MNDVKEFNNIKGYSILPTENMYLFQVLMNHLKIDCIPVLKESINLFQNVEILYIYDHHAIYS